MGKSLLSGASCLLVSRVAWPLQILLGKTNINKLSPIWPVGCISSIHVTLPGVTKS
jgi:hypothetical protein